MANDERAARDALNLADETPYTSNPHSRKPFSALIAELKIQSMQLYDANRLYHSSIHPWGFKLSPNPSQSSIKIIRFPSMPVSQGRVII
jgi:hypothetical protein